MIFKVLALVLALLGYYISPYGPNIGIGGPIAEESRNREGSATSGSFYLAQVTRVADGDTITVRNLDGVTQKIRMHAVDAPELNQAGGEQSKR
jgi:endonuclease YncB( thermonuclease family)